MSGDQSEYIRGKEAVRSRTQDVRFMKDGFDEWAQSTRPAREGQIEKNPSEEQMTTTGGAMSLKKAKHLAKYLGKTMRRGGNIVDDIMALVPENIKNTVSAVIETTKGVLTTYRNVSSFIDDFIEELKDEFVDNPQAKPSTKKMAIKLVEVFNNLKKYKDSLDSVAKVLEGVGLGRGGQRRGGDLAATTQTIIKKAKEIFNELMKWLKFFYDNAKNIAQFMKLKTLNRADLPFKGEQLLQYIQPIFDVTDKLSGLLGPKTGGRNCCMCGDSDEEEYSKPRRRGGMLTYGTRMGMDGQEKQEYSPYMGYSGFGPAVMKREQVYESEQGPSKSDAKRLLEKLMKFPDEELTVKDREMKQYLMKVVEEEKRRGGRTTYASSVSSSQGRIGGRRSERGEIVKKVMREQGLSLPQASKYVKDNGLY